MATKNDNQKQNSKEAVRQFLDAHLRGNEPDVEELVKKYPELEQQIRQKIEKFRKVDSLFDALVQADESDFENIVTEPDLVGRKIGSFEITKMIGRGGMGVVYLAHDTKLKRSVAIKSMPASLTENSNAHTRFRREAELLASLNHPNIAIIHEIIEEEESGYLVLEYVAGETLAERIAREPPELEEALSIGHQIAEAISAAHKEGVVHRDLKPGNIKITPEGRVKVLDFGLAKTYDRDHMNSEATATHPGRIIGTPAYMSPEQARGKKTDHRTDIWSFGCIMYQMLTGHLPFEGETTTDTLARIIEREPDWELLPKNTPANIRTLVRRCLEKDLDQRLGDITHAVIEISEGLNTPPVTLPVRLRRIAITVGIIVIIVLSSVVVWFTLTPPKEIRLAVLPYKHDGPVKNEDVTAGITIEITSLLAKIHSLSIISHLSAIQYKHTDKNTQQIAKELHADYILEGRVQYEHPVDPNSLVSGVTSRLTRMSDGTLVWSERHNNIFQVKSDLAKQIAKAMDIKLLQSEQATLAYIPTENNEAYVYYLRGNEYSSRLYQQNEKDLIIAIQMYEKAVELDDTFALAYAWLSEAHSGMYHFYYDRSEERLAKSMKASQRALELDPELPEAHWARGVYYYWCRSDYDHALEELKIARKSQSDNSQLLATIGYIQRAQRQYEPALTDIKRAFEYNPLDYRLAVEIGNTFREMCKYPEAEFYYERAISLAPDEYYPYYRMARLYLVWKGSTQEARAALERIPEYINLADQQRIVNMWFELDVLDKKYEEALARLPLEPTTTDELYITSALRYAQIYSYMKKIEMAEKYYDKARSILETKVEEDPNNAFFHAKLGIAFAGLGRKEDATKEVVKLFPYTKDRDKEFNVTKDMALIYVMAGRYDEAIDQLKHLLSMPGPLSIPLLQLDPAWCPLHDHPRFQKLLESDK